MQTAIKQLREFHEKHRFPLDKKLHHYSEKEIGLMLLEISNAIFQITTNLENYLKTDKNELRLHRTHLILEEAAESIQAMATGNELELMDGLSDLLFVTIGTSETFGLPTEEGLLEVCKSNLTKAVRKSEDVRLRDKGDSFIPPDMKGVLKRWQNLKE